MRFNVLDSWRGIAALLVAAYHFEATSHIYQYAFFRNAFLFVDFFFVLSGFVIAHAYGERISNGRQLAGFALRRFGRLYPLHFAVLCAFVGTELVKLGLSSFFGIAAGTAAFDPAGYTPLATLPSHFALTTGLGVNDTLTWNGPDWSISAEFWTYLVFALVVLSTGRWRLPALALTGCAAAAFLIAHSNVGMDATYEYGFPRCIYGFMTGQLVYAVRTAYREAQLPQATLLESAALLAVVVFVTIAHRSALSYLAPFVFAAVTLVFSYEQGGVSRLMQGRAFHALGDWSYSIYMVHAFIWFVLGMGLSVLGRKFGFEPWQIVTEQGMSRRVMVLFQGYAADALLAAYLAAVLMVASLTKRFIEDPGRRYFNDIARGVERPRPAQTTLNLNA